MMSFLPARAVVRLALVLVLMAAPASVAAQPSAAAAGKAIAKRDCGACHATGRRDRSKLPAAAPFRTLGAKYDVADLGEALAEGISVGHPTMPQAAYPPDQVSQLIAYLTKLQPRRPSVGEGGR